MGMDVGKVTIEYLRRPDGLVYEFIGQLASETDCVGCGNAFGFYERGEVEERAREFANGNALAERILLDWVAELPWDEAGCLILVFSY